MIIDSIVAGAVIITTHVDALQLFSFRQAVLYGTFGPNFVHDAWHAVAMLPMH